MVVTSKGWTLDSLLATAPNFALAHSLDRRATALASRVSELLERGLPVVVTGYDEHETMAGREFSLDHVRAPHVLGSTSQARGVPCAASLTVPFQTAELRSEMW